MVEVNQPCRVQIQNNPHSKQTLSNHQATCFLAVQNIKYQHSGWYWNYQDYCLNQNFFRMGEFEFDLPDLSKIKFPVKWVRDNLDDLVTFWYAFYLGRKSRKSPIRTMTRGDLWRTTFYDWCPLAFRNCSETTRTECTVRHLKIQQSRLTDSMTDCMTDLSQIYKIET